MALATRPARRDGPRINREPSPALAIGIPWVSIILATMATTLVMVATSPLVPPLGFLMFVAWRQVRPGLMPAWAGLPLGLVDDLYSGNPFGTAVLLWSLTVIVLDVVEVRLPWRNFLTEWLVAAGLILAYIVFTLALANLAGGSTPVFAVVPQIVLSILLFPLNGRLVALLDKLRLLPIREIG